MATAAQIRSNAKYDKEHTTGLYLKFNNGTDKDILEYLKSVPNKQGFIKELIRQAMNDSVPNSSNLVLDDMVQKPSNVMFVKSVPDSAPDCTIVPVSVPNKFMNDLKKEAKENNETVSELIWLVALQDMPWLTNK